jgi:hypothetical protein
MDIAGATRLDAAVADSFQGFHYAQRYEQRRSPCGDNSPGVRGRRRRSAGRGRIEEASIKAIAFDAFPVFDPRSVFALADGVYPGAGLSDEWRTRQFEYTWLRVVARHDADFWHVTEDALVFAANRLKLKLSPGSRATLMDEFFPKKRWV